MNVLKSGCGENLKDMFMLGTNMLNIETVFANKFPSPCLH